MQASRLADNSTPEAEKPWNGIASDHDHEKTLAAARRTNRLLRYYIPSDMFGLLVGFSLAWGFSLLIGSMTGLSMPFGQDVRRVLQLAVITAGVVVWFQHIGLYRVRIPFWQESRKILSGLASAMMVDGFLLFASGQQASKFWMVAGWLMAALAIIICRGLVRHRLRALGRYQMPTVLVGRGATAERARAAFESEPSLGYVIVAQIENLPEAFIEAGKSWGRMCAQRGAHHVLIAIDGDELQAAETSLSQLMRESVPFTISTMIRHLPVHGMMPQYMFNHDTLLLTRASGLEQRTKRIMKRTVDLVLSGLALLALSPLLLTLALLVKRDGGPALFGHMRLGRGGVMFPCYKFRSMVTHGDKVLAEHLAAHPEARTEWEETHKLVNDPRVTKIGAFLRKTSLDELPQLLNVFRGQMSLVGPRPIVPAEVEKYAADIAHYYRVRPGITGLWQVSGRSDVSYPRRVSMDSWYVRNWSLWHDFAIICKTLPALLKRDGAY